nr:hypothetical protein [uncultured Flavobacterium sp.]
MKTFLTVITMLILPHFMNAQSFSPSQIKPQNDIFPMQERNPRLPQMPTIKPLYRSRIENAEAKLAKENRKLTKLAKKAWKHEDDFKKKQENLKKLENIPENSDNPGYQKKIEIAKKQIAKSQDKLNEAKKDVESGSKKVEDLEKKIEEAKFTRQE